MSERTKEAVGQVKDLSRQPRKKVKRMFWGLSSDAWNNVLIAAGFLTALGAIPAAVAIYATVQLSKDKDAAVDAKVADAKQEGIKAGRAAAGAQTKTQELEQRTTPRRINREKFLNILKGEPVGSVEIIYGEEAAESYALSLDLFGVLKQGGWKVSSPTPIPTKQILKLLTVVPQNMLMIVRSFSLPDDWLEANNLSLERTNPVKKPPKVTLLAAILATIGGGVAQSDPSLPEGFIRLIVCPR